MELSKQVLVVDDEEGMRDMLSLILQREGFDVLTAESGEQALAMLPGNIHIIVTDVRMPGMDGLALLKRIVALKLPVTVIMMSAYVDHDTAIQALKAGALDYISKPFKNDEVVLKIKLAEERIRLAEEQRRLRSENERLRRSPAAAEKPASTLREKFIGKSKKIDQIWSTVEKVADYKSTVLVTGESGTGKEIVARSLHLLSSRKDGPFIPINCGAIPETLLESELFGYVRGAFTDARRDKKGLIEEAEGGTLFLDEIGELPTTLQVKLLRFLQEEEIRRVGDTKGQQVDVRVIAATAVDLTKATKTGHFREDLFYRLNVLQVTIPPLRERKEDIPLLAEHFIEIYSKRLKREIKGLSRDALRALMEYQWPGNVRELENCVERAIVLTDGTLIDVDALPEKVYHAQSSAGFTLSEDELSIKKASRRLERELIRRALERTGGNRTRAAQLLEISHRALLYKIKEYHLN